MTSLFIHALHHSALLCYMWCARNIVLQLQPGDIQDALDPSEWPCITARGWVVGLGERAAGCGDHQIRWLWLIWEWGLGSATCNIWSAASASNVVSARQLRLLYPRPSLRNSADLPKMSQTQQLEASDSITSQDPSREDSKKTKSKRPPSKPGRRCACWETTLTDL